MSIEQLLYNACMKPLIPLKKFYFVRHGCTEWNVKKLCQGHRDIELNEAGRQEARGIATFARDLNVSAICTSPLKRALETAQIVHRETPKTPFYIIEHLKERSWGELEGISSAEMYRLEEQEEIDSTYQIGKGVEDRFSFQARLIEGFTEALEKEGVPLIISHGRVFLTLCDILNLSRIRQIPNATPIEFMPAGHSWNYRLVPCAI